VIKPGVLALWMDCAEGREAEYERWYQTEHLAERVGLPGFRLGRRYEAVVARQRYFVCYETDAPEVFVSLAYRAQLDNPSPLTRTIMTGVMQNMSRTICRIERRIGAFRGAFVVTAPLTSAEAAGEEALATLAAGPGVARLELWAAVEELAPPPSDEEKLRGGDARVAACLVVETLREADARAAAAAIRARLGQAVVETGIYRLLCGLGKGEAGK
jgi:hypothetical protein